MFTTIKQRNTRRMVVTIIVNSKGQAVKFNNADCKGIEWLDNQKALSMASYLNKVNAID